MNNSKFDEWAFDQTVTKGGTIFGCKDKSGVNVGFVNTGTGEYFNLSDEWINTSDKLPPYGEPVLIKSNGVTQHITYMLDGGDDTPDWFEPYHFEHEDCLKTRWDKVESWQEIPE